MLRENIRLTNVALKERVGVEANGFRTPGGFATAFTAARICKKCCSTWASIGSAANIRPTPAWKTLLPRTKLLPSEAAYANILAAQSEAQPFVYPTGLLEIPMSPISDIGAFRNGRWQLEHLLKAIRLAMEWVIERRAVFDFLCHPSVLGVVDPKFQAIDLICDLVERSNGAAEIVSLDVIAKRARPKLAAK